MRELYTTQYHSDTFTDENLLYKGKLMSPDRLNRGLTWMYGKDSDAYPLLYLTEGQGNFKRITKKALNDTQYEWDVFGRMKVTSKVLGLVNSSNTYPGINFTPFEVDFEDNWLIPQHAVFTPDGEFQVRVEKEPTMISPNRYRYTFTILTGDNTKYVTLDNFIEGNSWALSAPATTASKSDGTRSNEMTPGKWTNQFGFHRFSKVIAGNITNKVVVIEFDTEGGGKTNYWLPFSMKQFEMSRKLMVETDLWHSEYNRDANGVIHNKDWENGEPVPKGAGVYEILDSVGNHDTYSILTLDKFDSVLNRIYSNRIGDTPTEIVLYTGAGGIRMFDAALRAASVENLYFQKVGEETVSGKGGYLEYGKYFNTYKTIDNKIITVINSDFFNQGIRARQDREQGRMYNGFPHYSYNMVFLDHSMNDSGERNIQIVYEDGREFMTGVYRGMTNLPGEWGAMQAKGSNEPMLLSTRKDLAAYEVFQSIGISISNPTTSFWLEFAA